MKQNKPKYRIIKQSRENIWGNRSYQKKFKAKKWSRMVRRLDRTRNFLFKKTWKPRTFKIQKKNCLLNKQKFKSFYGHLSYNYLKTEFKTLYNKKPIDIIDQLQVSLEHRLDVFLFRSGLFKTIFGAKQAIIHKHIYVNGTCVSVSNYKLKNGDYIRVPKGIRLSRCRILPYSQVSLALRLIIFLRAPKKSEIKYPFNFKSKYLFEYLNTK